MNKRMIYLISLIAEMSQKLNIPKRYSKKFINSGNEYLSPTEKIRIEDLTDHFVTAGIVGRTEVLPILGKDGYRVMEFEPDIIGGQFPYSASDLIQLKAGLPMYTKTGAEIPTIKQLEAKYSRMIAAAIDNRFEKQCAEAYLKGTYTDKDKKVFEVGVKSDKPLSWTKGTTVFVDEVLKLALAYQTKNGVWPEIEVGETIFNAIKNEANDTRQNINKVEFRVDGNEPFLMIGTQKVGLLVNVKGTDDKEIDTKNLIILSNVNNLAVGYGCLVYGDIANNESVLVRSKVIAGDTKVDETTGSKGLWGKSAPMPVILSTAKFERYKVTIS